MDILNKRVWSKGRLNYDSDSIIKLYVHETNKSIVLRLV